MIVLVPASEEHARVMAPLLRDADLQEIKAGAGWNMDPAELLKESVRRSSLVWCALDEQGPVAIFGLAILDAALGIAAPWMMGTPRLTGTHRRQFVRQSREWVNQWAAQWKVLTNFVDARNKESIRWLKSLGFTIHPAQPFGPTGMLFRRFELRNN